MQTRGSINKSPIKLSMQQKINNTAICLRMRNFKVTTPEIPLLSQQAVTSKGIPVPYTNLQLNIYSNSQLDLFCINNFSF